MNKEQLAQIVLKNYIELAQAMDPNIKDNNEELVDYFEVLQQQVLSEMNKLITKQDETSTNLNTVTEETKTPVYEQQQEYSEEMITKLAQQLIETGTLTTLTPLSEELMDKIAERAKLLQQPKQARPRLFQNSMEKIRNSGLVRNISLAERKLLNFLTRRIKKQEQLLKDEIDENIDKDYIEEMAQILVERRELLTLAPISEKYMSLIEQRAKEIRANFQLNLSDEPSKDLNQEPFSYEDNTLQKPEEIIENDEVLKQEDAEYKNDVIAETNPITPPIPMDIIPEIGLTPPRAKPPVVTPTIPFVTPIIKVTPPSIPTPIKAPAVTPPTVTPIRVPVEQSTITVPLTDADIKYIDKAARLYLKEGHLTTFGGPPILAKEILQRAQEIKQQEGLNNELSEMFTEESVETETRVSTK